MNITLRGLHNNTDTLKNINSPELQIANNRVVRAIDKIESSIKDMAYGYF